MALGSHKLKDLEAGWIQKSWDFLKSCDRKVSLLMGLGCFVVMSLVVFMIRTQPKKGETFQYKAGEVAGHTVRAQQVIEFVDPDSEQIEKSQIVASMPPVFDLDSEAVGEWVNQWSVAVKQLRTKARLDRKNQKKLFEEKLGFSLSSSEFDAIIKVGFGLDLERSIQFSMGPLWDLQIVENRNLNVPSVELVDIRTGKTSFLKSTELNVLVTVDEARALVGKASRTQARNKSDSRRLPWVAWDSNSREVIFAVQARLVSPTVTLNRKETELRREALLKDFQPTKHRIEKGEVIVREGEKVTRKSQLILDEISLRQNDSKPWSQIPFEVLMASLALWVSLIFLKRAVPKRYLSNKDLVVSGAILVTSLALLKLSLIFQLHIVAEYFQDIPKEFFVFLIPLAAPTMILRLLVRTPLAAFFSVVYGASVGIMMGDAGLIGLHLVVTSLMAASFLRTSRTRTDLHTAGFKTALLTAAASVIVVLTWGGHIPEAAGLFRIEKSISLNWTEKLLWVSVGAFVGGWLSSAILMIVTPMIEGILDYTTDLKLLELARMDHPLLRELVLKAPGTYHHSIVVGSLAEAGCEAVGANSLLARVGAYYHDIGKIGRAEYFVENQNPTRNPHEEMSPQLSAKIIIAHVKEGRVMAEQHKLGQALIDFIEQHHGTSLVAYFYNKAKHEATKPGSTLRPEDIREEDFRYPGPKPQTKEAAVMALADSCEAATRSLVDPTPGRIQGMIQKIITKAFSEGLLDEADITLREVQSVGQAFLRILLGIHHNRIQYPDQEKGLPPQNQESAKILGMHKK
jgi:putative nucleotidyltransferase with HDIG domain